MGLSDLLKTASNKATELVQNEANKRQELRQLHIEQQNMPQVFFYIQAGAQLVNSSIQATMYQRSDGTIFFNNNSGDSFSLIGYSWNGPVYNSVQSSISNTNGKEVTKGRMGKMTAGAIIGSAIMPGFGTAVGAAIGGSGKKKKNINSTTRTNSFQRQMECMTPATLTFINNKNGQRFGITISCNSLIDSKIKCFIFSTANLENNENIARTPVSDCYEEIKKAKELLDMGIITPEEFEIKKSQLLNL